MRFPGTILGGFPADGGSTSHARREIFSGRQSSSEKFSTSVPRPNNEDKYSANSSSDKCSPEKIKKMYCYEIDISFSRLTWGVIVLSHMWYHLSLMFLWCRKIDTKVKSGWGQTKLNLFSKVFGHFTLCTVCFSQHQSIKREHTKHISHSLLKTNKEWTVFKN